MKVKLTKRQEKQLNKVFNNPKKLRKWIDEVYIEMLEKCKDETEKRIWDYIDIYSLTVAFTLRYYCGYGKKRLPEVMQKIWNNLDCFRTGHLSIDDCINELKEYGFKFDTIFANREKCMKEVEIK